MSEKMIRLQLFAGSIFVIVFNVLFFLFGGLKRPYDEWITYLFVMLAYASTICAPIIIKAEDQGSMGISFKAVAFFYYAIELILATVVLLVKPNNPKMVFAIQFVLLGAFLLIAVFTYLSNRKTIEHETDREEDISFIKCASGTIDGLADIVNDIEIRKSLRLLRDTMHSSQAKSDPLCYKIEDSIKSELAELENMIVGQSEPEKLQEKINVIQQLINTRNKKLRIVK